MSSGIKFDKETLIKHRFWIGLGVFAPLWLVAWLVLWLSVSDAVELKKTEYAKSVKDIEGVKDPKGKDYTDPMNVKKGTLADRKNIVWEEVYNTQGQLATEWISNGETPQLAGLPNAPFMTPIKDDEARGITATEVRRKYRDDLYKIWRENKRKEFYDLAGPMTFDFDNVIRMAPITENPEYPVTIEEMWLNAETVWAKRELMFVLWKTLQDIAYFHPVKVEKDEPIPAGVVARHRFRNSNWELDLLLKHGDNRQLLLSKNSTIKNINAGRRTLPLREIRIMVAQTSVSDPNQLTQGREFKIEGDPVPWNYAVAIGHDDVRVDAFGFTENQPMWATQVFTWGTSPIKQIDRIELGYQSSRTAFQALRGFKAEEEAAPAAAAATPNVAAGGMIGAQGGGTAPTVVAAGKSGSPLGINPKRYIQVTPQVRRIPVGIVVAIDQAYIEDLMSHLVNNRLRFQPTQVQWQQDTRGLKEPDHTTKDAAGPEMVGAGKGGAGPMIPGGAGAGEPGMGMMKGQQERMQGMMAGGGGQESGMGRMMGMQNQMQGRMIGNRPGGANLIGGREGGPAQLNPATAEESDPNIVELAIYGIISLYDQYTPPAQGAAPKEGEQPKPGTPPKADPPKADVPKTDGTPKAEDQPKAEPAPKNDEKKNEAAPKADEKKTNEKPAGGEAKKVGENKGS